MRPKPTKTTTTERSLKSYFTSKNSTSTDSQNVIDRKISSSSKNSECATTNRNDIGSSSSSLEKITRIKRLLTIDDDENVALIKTRSRQKISTKAIGTLEGNDFQSANSFLQHETANSLSEPSCNGTVDTKRPMNDDRINANKLSIINDKKQSFHHTKTPNSESISTNSTHASFLQTASSKSYDKRIQEAFQLAQHDENAQARGLSDIEHSEDHGIIEPTEYCQNVPSEISRSNEVCDPEPQNLSENVSPLEITNDGVVITSAKKSKRSFIQIHSSKNIVHQLVNRTTFGHERYPKPKYHIPTDEPFLSDRIITPPICRNKVLHNDIPKMTPWLTLAETNKSNGDFLCCWDDIGVLFATADLQNGTICIYDWDTVKAADTIGRSRQCREGVDITKSLVMTIDPIMKFGLSSIFQKYYGHSTKLISFMHWNGCHHDELVIGSRVTGFIYLLDLEAIGLWLENRSPNCVLPHREIRCGQGQKICKDSKVEFVKGGKYALLSTETSIICWYFGSDTTQQHQVPKTLWTFSPWQQGPSIIAITTFEVISSEMLIVGSSHGSLMLINWKKLQRTTSFSTCLGPTILEKWSSYDGIMIYDTPISMMGVLHIKAKLETQFSYSNNKALSTKSNNPIEHEDNYFMRFRLTWATVGGWMLSSSLDIECSNTEKQKKACGDVRVKRHATNVIFQSNPVRCISSEGNDIVLSSKSWSLPTSGRIVVNNSMYDGFIWERVPDATIVLPARDGRVVGDKHPTMKRDTSQKPQLLWLKQVPTNDDNMAQEDVVINEITLSRRFGPPTIVIVHPNNEWLVVGSTNFGLVLFNSRQK